VIESGQVGMSRRPNLVLGLGVVPKPPATKPRNEQGQEDDRVLVDLPEEKIPSALLLQHLEAIQQDGMLTSPQLIGEVSGESFRMAAP
jgi:hypothetical protein